MSNVPITPGTGASSVATETVAGIDYQKIQLWGAGGGSIAGINPDGSLRVSIMGTIGTHSVAGTVGASVIGTAPVTQVGTWTVGLLAPTASFISGVTSVITGTTPTSVLSAAGGSIKNYVTHIIATNAATVGTFIDIKDGGGNIIYSGFAAASGGGFSSHIYPPLVGSANKSVDASARTQASVIVAMTGYTA